MKWLLLLLPGGLFLILILDFARRRRDRFDGRYVEIVQKWHAKDPQIAPLPLPAVRKLTAQKIDRVARFKRRAGGER